MMNIKFKSVRTRLTFWFLLVAIIPLITSVVITYEQRVQVIKSRSIQKLIAIRDLKVLRVNDWLDEKIGDIKTISQDYEMRSLEISTDGNRIIDTNQKNTILTRHHLNNYINNYKDYDEIFIIDPTTGDIILSSRKTSEGTNKSTESYFLKPLQTKDIYIRDIYYSKAINKNSMALSIPVFGIKDESKIIGILVARIDLQHSLYRLLLDRTGMGETGETLIVNKNAYAISELRWDPNAPLNFKIKAAPAVKASQGNTGIIEIQDYRGEKVLAAYAHIPRTGWGFVAKEDVNEVNRPMQAMLNNLLILIAFSICIAYGVAYVLARAVARPLQEMANVSKKIQAGDFTVRNNIQSEDELGFLATSFNSMADSIASKIRIQQTGAEISETMASASNLYDFANGLLLKLKEVTNSNLGAFYLLSDDSSWFSVFCSVGLTKDLRHSLDAQRFEGDMGAALKIREIIHTRNIMNNTPFIFKTFAGNIFPKEIITIPVMRDGTVAAMLSLASIQPYSHEHVLIINQNWMAINTAFSNLFASEQTRKLAHELEVKNDELQKKSDELKNSAEELKLQSEELHEQNIELEVQRNQVEDANRLKSEFLSNMSHELRTPLNSIMALSRVLIIQARDSLKADERGYLEVIERNGKKLLELINDILDLSKIEAGKMDIHIQQFSLRRTIDTIVENLEPLANEKGIELSYQIREDFPDIDSDEIHVHHILQNIISNAIKFTNHGYVCVTATHDDVNVRIHVQDTGIGIPAAELSHIFDEFRQVDGSTARKYEGTGLGLAIAYKASKILGGNIEAQSTVDEGSLFTVHLPITWDAHMQNSVTNFNTMQHVKPTVAAKTILVVDDDPEILSYISQHLTEEGYHVITSTSGKDVVALAREYHPFAITLDIIMPGIDGWEALQQLKSDKTLRDIPVIMISVSDDLQTSLALGAMGYLNKPIDKKKLLGEIKKISSQKPQTILIVDDNDIDRMEIARIAESGDIAVISVDSGEKCLDALQNTLPDVIILDLMMPGMSGFDVLKSIRSQPQTRDLPVIIVTAKELNREDKNRLSGNVSSIIEISKMTPANLMQSIKNMLEQIHHESTRKIKTIPASGPRILLVEDNESTIIQIKIVLENEGYVVDVATGGQEGIEYVQHTIPDGIILDLMMPEIDGFQVLNTIRSKHETASIPVLILTAKDLTVADRKHLAANNVQQLIQKGDIDKDGLLKKMRTLLGLDNDSPSDKLQSNKAKKSKTNATVPRSRKRTELPMCLVIEDNPDNMLSIRAVLKNHYNVLEAVDGEQGIVLAREYIPQIILLDISLPKMDGYAVTREMKADQRTRDIPIIALTAHVMKGDREKIMAAGFDGYISKPIEVESILEEIGQFVGSV
ncbi:response regulator [candidate division KSB1 bacterium]|nr:response regulator [candidate division KSB1 bacterium]